MSFSRFSRAYCEFEGYRVAYAVAGDGPPVLLLHGLGGTADFWHPLVARLSGNFTVVCPDLLGFGYSDKPRIDYTLARHLGAMLAVLRAAKLPPHAIVGHSAGGVIAVALVAAGAMPGGCLALAATPYPSTRFPLRQELIRTAFFEQLLRRRWLARLDLMPWHALWPLMRRLPAPVYLQGAWAGFLDYTADSFYSTAEECLFRANLDPLLPALRARPTLLLYGPGDGTVPLVHGQRLEAMLPHSTCITLAGGHYAVLREGLAPLEAWLREGV